MSEVSKSIHERPNQLQASFESALKEIDILTQAYAISLDINPQLISCVNGIKRNELQILEWLSIKRAKYHLGIPTKLLNHRVADTRLTRLNKDRTTCEVSHQLHSNDRVRIAHGLQRIERPKGPYIRVANSIITVNDESQVLDFKFVHTGPNKLTLSSAEFSTIETIPDGSASKPFFRLSHHDDGSVIEISHESDGVTRKINQFFVKQGSELVPVSTESTTFWMNKTHSLVEAENENFEEEIVEHCLSIEQKHGHHVLIQHHHRDSQSDEWVIDTRFVPTDAFMETDFIQSGCISANWIRLGEPLRVNQVHGINRGKLVSREVILPSIDTKFIYRNGQWHSQPFPYKSNSTFNRLSYPITSKNWGEDDNHVLREELILIPNGNDDEPLILQHRLDMRTGLVRVRS